MSKSIEPFKGQKGNVYKINLGENPELVTEIPGFNERVDYGDIDWLVESIIRDGLRVPAQGYFRGDRWFITDGHRRLRASMEAVNRGHDVVFLIQAEPQGYQDADRLLDMLTRNAGKPLTMLEQARVFARLARLNFNEQQIATRSGFTLTHVRDAFSLLQATEEVQKEVEAGTVAATTVVVMQKEHSPEDVGEMISEARAANPDKKRLTPKDIPGARAGRGKERNAEKRAEDVSVTACFVAVNLTDIKERLEFDDRNWNPYSKSLFDALFMYGKGEADFDHVAAAFLD